MSEVGVDALLVSVGSDLPYLTGYRAVPMERLTMGVVLADDPVWLIVPELEAPRVEPLPGLVEVKPWSETENPVDLASALCGRASVVAIGDQTWSTFLLELQAKSPRIRFVAAGPVMSSLRVIKDRQEIDLLRRAAAAADTVAVSLADQPFAGYTERAIARRVGDLLADAGSETTSFAIVAAGPNAASPHHDPSTRVIESGDAVVVDFGGTIEGYGSDTTRTFHVGEPAAEVVAVHAVVHEAQQTATAAALAGVPAEDVDRAARNVIVEAGYGPFFIHRTGHGIGLDTHEAPFVVAGNQMPLAPGMAFSIEPGIYLPGKFGVRIEDIVICTDTEPESLNQSSRDLVIVE